MTSARERLHALWTDRGWAVGTSRHRDRWESWLTRPCSIPTHYDGNPPDETLRADGPTEEAAIEALLAEIEPAALPRLAPTLRGEARRLLAVVQEITHTYRNTVSWLPDLEAVVSASSAQREAWLAAYPDASEAPTHHEHAGWTCAQADEERRGQRLMIEAKRREIEALTERADRLNRALAEAERERDEARAECERLRAGSGWVRVEDRLPEAYVTVVLFLPGTPRSGFHGGDRWFLHGSQAEVEPAYWLDLPPMPETKP